MKRTKNQWRSIPERAGRPPFEADVELAPDAFSSFDPPAGQLSRRRFLGLLGASAGLAGAACSRPGQEQGVVPYTRQPEEVIPGVANRYATAYVESGRTLGVVVTTREARPIHIEGNRLQLVAPGKITARTQAQILSLYDPDRVRTPRLDGAEIAWDAALERVAAGLRGAREAGRKVVLLTEAVVSPSLQRLIGELRGALPTLHHVAWEPTADGPARTADKACFGAHLRVRPNWEKARVLLSLGQDFLGDGNDPAAIRGFTAGRRVESREHEMSRLYVVEGRMSLTGSNADERLMLRPARTASFAFTLARRLHEEGVPLPPGLEPSALSPFDLDVLAEENGLALDVLEHLVADLSQHRGEALVVAGFELPAEAHVACHLLNAMLGAEGSTLELEGPSDAPPLATDAEMRRLAAEMSRGEVAVALLWGANPLYSSPSAPAWEEALAEVPLRVRLGLLSDETAAACQVVLPVHHWLESWGDARGPKGTLFLQQPTLSPLHDTRQAEELLLTWLSALGSDPTAATYRDHLRDRWQREVYPVGSPVGFEVFWSSAVHDGLFLAEAGTPSSRSLQPAAVVDAAQAAAKAGAGETEWELVLHADSRIYDGRHANIGWLQELPEPVSKLVWGNALALAPADAERLGLADGDEVEVTAGQSTVHLPSLVQPGQTPGVVSTALGFGRRAGSVAQGVGTDAFPLLGSDAVSPRLRPEVQIRRTGRRRLLTRTQEHHRIEGRDLARAITLAAYAGHEDHHPVHHPEADLYPVQEFPLHKWGMVLDLNACVGCSACMVGCQSENNVPVVGPEQVRKGREMHWIRVDRYYEGSPENPAAVHQPMLCQHCDKAPCENVCPVNATTHSAEGLNQMAYNRCVGTRYCANNCPYKVRRFNFFDLHSASREPSELAFNPEVSIRPRGVMEKCTFCVQRIEDGKQRAKSAGRAAPQDGEIQPACAAACPAEAIVFGDLRDPESRVSRLWTNDRGYRVLEAELGVSPAITYLTKLRNRPGKGEPHES